MLKSTKKVLDKDFDMHALTKSIFWHGIINLSVEVNDNTLIDILYILYLRYIYMPNHGGAMSFTLHGNICNSLSACFCSKAFYEN